MLKTIINDELGEVGWPCSQCLDRLPLRNVCLMALGEQRHPRWTVWALLEWPVGVGYAEADAVTGPGFLFRMVAILPFVNRPEERRGGAARATLRISLNRPSPFCGTSGREFPEVILARTLTGTDSLNDPMLRLLQELNIL